MSRPAIRFGTDGVRGPAGRWPLDLDGCWRIGRALAELLVPGAEVVIGRDSRASGPALSAALAGGLRAGGARAVDAGLLPTAGLSLRVVDRGAAAGLMVTASHNPSEDNGVKVVGPEGRKLPDEAALEAGLARWSAWDGLVEAAEMAPDPEALGPWRRGMPALSLAGWRILLDCANGAAATCAPLLLRERGAELVLRGCEPDGHNINAGVGALHPPRAAEVAAAGCDLAICLDGDADRLVMVDPERGLVDGDDVLWLMAPHVPGPLVGTVMSNGGLEAALGGRLLRAPVGDRNVALHMSEQGAQVGAEPSGHVLFADGPPTGDGLYAALRLLSFLPEGQRRLPLGGWIRWASAQRSLRYSGPRPGLSLSTIAAAEAAGNRLVVRYSGTEPLLRVLVEGAGQGAQGPEAWADRICEEFRACLSKAPGAAASA